MLSVQTLNPINQNKQIQKTNLAPVMPQIVTKDQSQAMMSILNSVANSNKANISFTGQVRPAYTNVNLEIPDPFNSISSRTQSDIWTESSKRIEGSNPWPKIKDINAWMISAETQKFMAVGGLAQVAEDLPMSFNTKSPNKNDRMSVVTPLYVNDNDCKLEKITKKDVEKAKKEGKDIKAGLFYKGVEVKKMGEIEVGMYDEWQGGKERKVSVEILKGRHLDTDYIFLRNDEAFNIDPAKDNNPDCKACYVKNNNGYNEVTRFALMSKAVYELMKESNDGKVKGLKAPNVAVLNDWHVGPLAATMRYTTKADYDTGKISKETKEYFDNTPTVYITHNLGYKGDTYDTGLMQKAAGTVLGDNARDILNSACGWRDYSENDTNKNSIFENNGLCSAKIGMSLADRIVPVSENYGEELKSSNNHIFGNGFSYLLNTRNHHGTFAPITNGYSKSKIVPSDKNVAGDMAFNKKCLSIVPEGLAPVKTDDINVRGFENGDLSIKLENKKELVKMFSRIVDREQTIQAKDPSKLTKAEKSREKDRRTVIYRAKDVDLNIDPAKLKDIPIMVSAGRLVGQKGYHNILGPALIQVAKQLPKGAEPPIIVVGGGPYEEGCLNALKYTKDQIMNINPEFGKRIVIVEGFAHTNTLANMGDFFFVPSNYEPCGLTQLEAMAKGALPITTSTGGLVNTVQDGVDGFRTKVFYDSDTEGRTAIYKAPGVDEKTMPKYNNEAMADTILEALTTFRENPKKIDEMKKTAMSRDFSWEVKGGPLEKYRALFLTGDVKADISAFNTDAPKVQKPKPVKIEQHQTETDVYSAVAGRVLTDDEVAKIKGDVMNEKVYNTLAQRFKNDDSVAYKGRNLDDIRMIMGDSKMSTDKLAKVITNMMVLERNKA